MIQRAGRPPAPAAGVDLSRKTSLVGRGTRSRTAGAGMRTRTGRIGAVAGRFAGFAVSLAALAWLGLGRPAMPPAWFDVGLAAVLALVLGLRLYRRARRVHGVGDARPARLVEQDLDLALLAIVATHVLLAFTGGVASPMRPVAYVVAALLVMFNRPAVAIAAVGLILGVELLLAWLFGHLAGQAVPIAVHGGFVVVFSLIYHLALSGTVAASRLKVRAGIDAHVEDLHQRAREYRLIVSGSEAGLDVQGGAGGREKWVAAAVEEVEGAMQAALEVVECALKTHTVAVYLLSPDERQLRLRECLSVSDHVSRRPVAAGEGLPGVVLRRREAVRLCGQFRGAIYYDGGPAPQAFVGVPLVARREGGPDEGFLRGVLVADRLEAEAFTEDDERLLATVAREILRTMEVERVMGYIREEKDEKVRFYRAIEALNLLSKPDEVCGAVVRLAGELAPLDFAALTLLEGEEDEEGGPGTRRHFIADAVGPGADSLKGEVFPDNAGLVANVVRLGSPLPGRDFHDMDRKVVFSETLKTKGLSTLKVLPLSVGETVVGTLVCGAEKKNALVGDAVRQLGVLAIQAAGAIARARLFEQTEKMATTDGLTGLNNHRRFQECFDSAMASARRYGRPCSLILTDVDHFKSVNDTYGHPAGDKVLKGVARILAAEARDTDVVARYGGEEFTVILPETDPEGARVIAERIRKRIEAEIFQTDVGPLRVTMSLGIAGYPAHGDHKQRLIDLADQALYKAKEGGRNQVVIAR
jgi:two-component system, cell cycle response regulator